MALKITRAADSRIIKSVLQRELDIPGGVTISVADIGGAVLREGTPIGYSTVDFMYHVQKTALIVSDATAVAVAYDVQKGSHFRVGDRFATEALNGQLITAIDKTTFADKDVITVAVTLGAVITAASRTVAFQSIGADRLPRYAPTAVAGSNYDVIAGESLLCDALLIAVLRTGTSPLINNTLLATLKGIFYIV